MALGADGGAGVRIALLVEGDTERAFVPHLREFLATRVAGRMPKIDPVPFDGPLPAGTKLRREVERLLTDGVRAADAVIALTDVYTGRHDFQDAADARAKMRLWVGPNQKFFPHAAQHDFEAWLLPYWDVVTRLAGSKAAPPGRHPEHVDLDRPPAMRIAEVFRTGTAHRHYIKPRDASKILAGQDLTVAAHACPELRAFLDTVLTLCGAGQLPP